MYFFNKTIYDFMQNKGLLKITLKFDFFFQNAHNV